jgi:hypothetical protein
MPGKLPYNDSLVGPSNVGSAGFDGATLPVGNIARAG